MIYAFCLSSRICTKQKFSLTCVLEDFSLVLIERHRGSFIFWVGGKWRLVGLDGLLMITPSSYFLFLGGGGEGSGGWWDLMMTPSSLDIVWGRSPLLSQNIWDHPPPCPFQKKGSKQRIKPRAMEFAEFSSDLVRRTTNNSINLFY